MDISVDDYLVGGVAIFDAHTGRGSVGEFVWDLFCMGSGCLTRLWCGVGGWATGCCPGAGGGWVGRRGDWGEGVFAGPMVHVLRQRRNCFGHRR
jgi:hypothetical protein